MFGAVNGILVDNSVATLGQFDVTTAFDKGMAFVRATAAASGSI